MEVSAWPRECARSQGPRAALIFQRQRTLGETSPSRVGLGLLRGRLRPGGPAVPADGPQARARPSRSRDNVVDREAPFPAEWGAMALGA